jgi:hypothetical protein
MLRSERGRGAGYVDRWACALVAAGEGRPIVERLSRDEVDRVQCQHDLERVGLVIAWLAGVTVRVRVRVTATCIGCTGGTGLQRASRNLVISAANSSLIRELAGLQEKYPQVLTEAHGKGLLIGMEFPVQKIGWQGGGAVQAWSWWRASTRGRR